MAGFSEEDIRRVREANDLVELFNERTPTRRRGRDFWCCCPFHQEKTPSCKIDPATQTWHCFGCGEGGDVITYIRKIDDLEFGDAIRYLANRAGIEVKENEGSSRARGHKARLKEICAETQKFYHMQLMRAKTDGAANARSYLSGRNLGGEIPKQWNLGYAPGRRALVTHLRKLGYTNEEMVDANVAFSGDRGFNDRFSNRVMFPIADMRGDCIAFGGRVLGDGEPKYLNSRETPLFHKSEVLYGFDRAKAAMVSTGVAIVVEGYTDVIAMHRAGFTNTVATLGTALTRQHIRHISHHAKNKIVYLFDGDEAGQRAADRALQFIDETIDASAGTSRIDLCAVTLPDNLDPADYLEKYDNASLRAIIDAAPTLIDFGIERRLSRFDLSTIEGRTRAVNEALQILAPIKDTLVAKEYALKIAAKTSTKEENVLDQLSSMKAPAQYPDYEPQQPAAPQRTMANLTTAQRNRVRTEREFLSLCAQNPAMVPDFLDELGKTQWSGEVHRQLAEIIIELVTENPAITVTDIITKATTRNHNAARVLTSSVTQGASRGGAHATLRYLADELTIQDMEQAIIALQSQMKSPDFPQDQADAYFQALAALQKDVAAMRRTHRRID